MNRVKENLQIFVPALIELVDGQYFPWDKIDNLFSKKIQDRISQSNGLTFKVEASIYDIIVAAKMKEPSAIRLLHFLNTLFKELIVNLNSSEKVLIKSNVRQMLTSLDSKYLNFLGEIATLNNLIKSKIYRLESIECRMPNGKSIDFKLRQIENNKFLLVEIVNIHLDDSRVENNANAIRKFMTNKLLEKIKAKKSRLENEISFYLIPVIWGGWQNLKIYSEFFKCNNLDLSNVTEPVSYLTYSDNAGYYEHHFSPISKLFK